MAQAKRAARPKHFAAGQKGRGRPHFPPSSSTKVVPSAAGFGDTRMPAARIASIFDSAPPFPPEMIAPA